MGINDRSGISVRELLFSAMLDLMREAEQCLTINQSTAISTNTAGMGVWAVGATISTVIAFYFKVNKLV